jgi:hypothetical protein
MQFDPANADQQRHNMLYPSVGFEKEINQVFNCAPSKLVVEWGSEKISEL